jgi:hypothetical protein
MSDALQRLIDSQEIRDCMARYARGVDRADWDAVADTYHSDAYDDHGDYKGDIPGFIAFAKDRVGSMPQAMHFLGQCLIEFASPSVAAVETYFMTCHTLDPQTQKKYGATRDGATVQLSHIGRYVDRFEKRAGAWKTAHRIVVFETTRMFLEDVPPIKPDWVAHRRDQDDPIYRLRRELGL